MLARAVGKRLRDERDFGVLPLEVVTSLSVQLECKGVQDQGRDPSQR